MCKVIGIKYYKNKTFINISLLLLAAIIILHGTYIRIRPDDKIPETDWLIILRLITCLFAGIIGIGLILKSNNRLGNNSKILIAYLFISSISIIGTKYPLVSIGYLSLTAGVSLLMIGIVHTIKNPKEINKIENVWLISVIAIIIKDTLQSINVNTNSNDSIMRLGMGITHANQISFLAAITFWLSFNNYSKRIRGYLWIYRLLVIFIIIKAKSRISIIAFIIGGLIYMIFSNKIKYRLSVILSIIFFVGLYFAFSVSNHFKYSDGIISYLKRGQTKERLLSFTGRTDIWKYTVGIAMDSPIIGHGFGVNRFYMGDIPNYLSRASHTHNDLLEVFMSTGILGLTIFLFILVRSFKWFIKYNSLNKKFSRYTCSHVVCILSMLLIELLFETRLGGRVQPIQPLFLSYYLALDLVDVD